MITAQDKLDAAERELKLRRQVYPNRVATGRMSAEFAASQIAIMAAIADDYRQLAEGERLI